MCVLLSLNNFAIIFFALSLNFYGFISYWLIAPEDAICSIAELIFNDNNCPLKLSLL